MARYFLLLVLPLCLTSCANDWDIAPASMWAGAGEFTAQPDFDWRLTGDARVAPLQVFDDGRQTWLQFAAGQAVPALFAATPQGEVPLSYRRREPYVVVDAKWRTLVMRGGKLWARAQHAGAPALASLMSQPVSQSAPLSGHNSPEAVSRAAATSMASLTPQSGFIPAPRPKASSGHFRAEPADGNMRQVLARWAQSCGWTFHSHHWAVDVDIPLAGSADFAGDFKTAVRGLLAATELAERPVQPCFYANQVLRVVPWTQACDRSAVPGGAS